MTCLPPPPDGRRPRLTGRWFAVWLALVLGAGPGIGALAADPPDGKPAPKEREIKAAFLFNFTKFIDWPAEAFARADSAFVFCVLGEAPLAAELERAVHGRRIGGRPIEVRPCRTAAEAAGGQLIFVAADDAVLRELVQRVAGRAVLIVGNSERQLRLGGTIAFLFERDDKVRFAINMAAAERAQLRVSAQLQKLAKSILREP